jgi:cytochrome c553
MVVGAMSVAALAFCSGWAVAADVEAGRKKAELCAACHGESGNSNIPANPSLAGQPAQSITLQLFQFREGNRKDPQMTPVAAGLSNADMNDLATYFSRQPPAAPSHQTSSANAAADAALLSSTIARTAMARRSWAFNTFRGLPGSRSRI